MERHLASNLYFSMLTSNELNDFGESQRKKEMIDKSNSNQSKKYGLQDRY